MVARGTGFSGLGYAYKRNPATAHIRCPSREPMSRPSQGEHALLRRTMRLTLSGLFTWVNSVSLLTAAKDGCPLQKFSRTLLSAT